MRLKLITGAALAALTFVAQPAGARELIYSSIVPAKHPLHSHGLEPYFERVTKATNGDLTFKLFPGGTLSSGRTTLNAIGNGTVDMGLLADVYTPNELATSAMISDLAVFGTDARVMTGAVNQTLLVDCADCKQDYVEDKVLPLASYSLTPYYLMCKDAKIVTGDDWKGKKLRGTGAMGVLAAEMGATPVNITSPEIYEALQRGQVDCVMGPQPWLRSYSLWDMVKYISNAKLGTYHGTNMLNINVNDWKKMTDAEKKAMVDNLAEAVTDMARVYEEDDISIRKEAEQKGIAWIEVDPSFTKAVEEFREKDLPRIIDLAKSRGVKNPEPNIALFRDNIAKWEKIVADIGEGEWGDAEWTKYQAAIQAEVYDKAKF